MQQAHRKKRVGIQMPSQQLCARDQSEQGRAHEALPAAQRAVRSWMVA